MSQAYHLPQLPLGGPEAIVLRWLKQPGDQLMLGDPLLVVLNDRAEFALPAPAAGILDAQLIAEGASVAAGAPLARIGAGQPVAAPPRISPVARRIAETLTIDITTITGSGPGGRILKRDLLALLDDRRPTTDDRPQAAETGDTRHETRDNPSPISNLQSPNLQSPIPQFPIALTAIEVDLSQMAAVRRRMNEAFARRGVELTSTACISLAAVEALLQHPLLNSSWSDAGIVLRQRVQLGIVVALRDGPITPVVCEAQDLNLRGLARALADVVGRARAGALEPGEASGGTFTIASLDAGALWLGAPLIGQSQSAFLGVGAIVERPLVIDVSGVDRIVMRPTTVLTLAYDARVLDQYHADAFLRAVKERLEYFTA